MPHPTQYRSFRRR